VEVIIIAIITMIISAFSKKKNADDGNGKSKPFVSKPLDSQPLKRIEDYAKEVYVDVKERTTERQSRQTPPPSELKSQVKQVEETILPSRVLKKENNFDRPGRLSVHQPVNRIKEKQIDKNSLVPNTKKELVQAIIFSEILAPPKSKR